MSERRRNRWLRIVTNTERRVELVRGGRVVELALPADGRPGLARTTGGRTLGIAAATLLGRSADTRTVPWFWSNQGDLRLKNRLAS
jgi:hypothetical protein